MEAIVKENEQRMIEAFKLNDKKTFGSWPTMDSSDIERYVQYRNGYMNAETNFYSLKAMSTDVIISKFEVEVNDLKKKLAEAEVKVKEMFESKLDYVDRYLYKEGKLHDCEKKLKVAVEALERIKSEVTFDKKDTDRHLLCDEVLTKISEGV